MSVGGPFFTAFDKFLHMCHFFNFRKRNAKSEIGPCPPPYEEALEAIIKAVWTEQ